MPLVLFNPYIEPCQVLPRRARVDLGAMVMKGVLRIPQSPTITGTSPSDCLVLYPGHSLGGLAEVQSVYSAAPADWASHKIANVGYVVMETKRSHIKRMQQISKKSTKVDMTGLER